MRVDHAKRRKQSRLQEVAEPLFRHRLDSQPGYFEAEAVVPRRAGLIVQRQFAKRLEELRPVTLSLEDIFLKAMEV